MASVPENGTESPAFLTAGKSEMRDHDKQGKLCQEYLEKVEVNGRYYQDDFWNALKWHNFC